MKEKPGNAKMPFRICTIFPELEDQHLPKEVVQLPYVLGKQMGAETRIVGVERGAELADRELLAPGVQFDILEDRGKFRFVERSILHYLYKNARSIDLLQLLHFQKRSFLLAILYKRLNPKGSVYLKGDVYNDRLARGEAVRSENALHRFSLRILEKLALRSIDLISVENREALRIFQERYPEHGEKCFHLPSGIHPRSMDEAVPEPPPLEERPKRILIVGRLGLYVKGHDILMKALEGIELKDHELRFIGPEYEGFEEMKQGLFQKRPDLQDRTSFAGPIRYRKELYREYAQGRFLCLPSRAESFGLVLIEAAAFGVIPIGTDAIHSFDDITQGERFGLKVPSEDPDALREGLQRMIDEPEPYLAVSDAYREQVRKNFDWEGIAEQLGELLGRR